MVILHFLSSVLLSFLMRNVLRVSRLLEAISMLRLQMLTKDIKATSGVEVRICTGSFTGVATGRPQQDRAILLHDLGYVGYRRLPYRQGPYDNH